jgi:hypothetical protein
LVFERSKSEALAQIFREFVGEAIVKRTMAKVPVFVGAEFVDSFKESFQVEV